MRQIHALYAPSEKDTKYNGKTEKRSVKAVKQPSQGEKGLPPGSEENRRTKMSKAWEEFKAQQKKLEQEQQELRPSKAWEEFKAQQKKLEQERQVSDPIEEDIMSRSEVKTIPVSTDTTAPVSDAATMQSPRVTAAEVVARNAAIKQQPTQRAATVSADRQQSARTAYAKRLMQQNKEESRSLFKQADDLYHQGDEEGYQQLREQGESLERTNEKLKEANPEANKSRLGNIVKAAGARQAAAAGELFGQLLAPTETNAIGAQARAAITGDDSQIQAELEKDKALQERIRNRAASIGEDSAEFTEQAKEGLGTIGRAGVDLGINALNLAADAGVAAATGGSSLIPMAVRTYGSGAQQARLGGGSELEQFGYGAMTAGVEAATERLSSIAGPLKQVYGAGAVDDAVQGLISKVGSEYGQKGLQVLASAAGEGIEEAVAGALDPLLQRLTYNEDAEFNGKDVAYDAALGAVMGGLLGLPGNVSSTDSGRVAEGDVPYNAAGNDRESTVVDTNPETHSPEANKVIEEYTSATDEGVKNFINKVRQLKNPRYRNSIRYSISEVAPRAVEEIRQKTGIDTTGFENIITGSAIDHIANRHGVNGKADHSMADDNDLARIGYVLDTFDDVTVAKNKDGTVKTSRVWKNRDGSRAEKVVFSKAINGTYYVVEAVPDSDSKVLAVESAYIGNKNNKESIDPILNMAEMPRRFTSETPGGANAFLVKDSITQKPESVNTMDVIEADIKGVGAAELGFDPYSRAMNEYGVIRERSDPNREVPKQIAGGEVSQAADTIVGSEYLSDTDLEAVRAMIAAGNANKKTVTWNDAYAQADAELESKGLNQAYLEWRQRQMDGTGTDYDTALSIRLLQTANKEGNSEISQGIFAAGWQEASNAGRKLQAQQMWKAVGPEGQLKIVNDQLVKLYNSLNSRQKKKLGDNKLQINPALAEEYRNATDDAQRDAVLEKIYKDTAQRIPNSFADRWNAWRYLSMLGNVRTHVRNTTGNTLQGAVRTVSDTASTAIQSVLPQSQREQSFVGLGKEASELRAVAKADAKEMKSVLSGNGKYSDLNVKNEVDKHRNYFGTSRLGRIINWAAKGNSKLLDVEDALFSTPAYRQYLARYLKAKGITAQQWQEMTDAQKTEAREYAVNRAQQAVFRDNNDFSDAISQLGSDKSTMTEKAIGHLVEAVIPYKRTPANILVTVEQYSPLGLINTAANTVKAAKGDVAAARAIDSACRSVTGTVLAAAGYILAKNGLLTGRVDDELEQMQGHQSYAFELFGHSYTLPNLGPAVVPLLVGAEIAENQDEEEGSMAGKVLNALLTVTEPVFETTMLSGLNDALSTDPYADENALIQFITRAVTNYLGQGVSSMGSAIANTLDDTRRTTYSTETGAAKIVDTAVQSNMNRMLGLREQGKVYVDRWGRTEDTGSMGQRAVENFLSPGYYSKIRSSPMEDELRRVMDATGEDVLPKYAPKSITYKDEKRELTAEENTRFQTTMGQMNHDLYTEITEMDGYGELSDEDKVKLLREARSLAENTAKKEFWGDGFENKELDKLTESGLPTSTALLARVATSEDNMPADKTADGETISNSRKLKVMHYVDGLDLDDSEKAAMLKYLGQDVGDVCTQAVEKGISYSDWTTWQSDLNGKLGHSGQTEVRRQYISNRKWTDEQKIFAADKAGLITKSMEGLMNMGASYNQAVDAKDEDDIAQTLMELGHDVGTACIIAAGLTDAGGKDEQRAAIYDLVEENGYSRDVLEDSIFAINRQDSSMPIEGGDSAFTVLDDDVRSSLTRLQGSSDFRITTLLPEIGGTTSIDGTTYTYDEEDIALWKDGYRAVYDLVDATAFKDAAVAEKIDEWATQTAKFFALWDDQGKEQDDIPAVYDKLHTAMDRGFTAEEYTKAYILAGNKNKTDTFAAWRKAGYSESQINTLWSILG